MVGKTIWQQVVFQLQTVETITVEMEVPVEDGDTAEDVLSVGMDLAMENSASIWTNPEFKAETELIFSRPRIVQWFPSKNGKPDYLHPLSYDPRRGVVQQGD